MNILKQPEAMFSQRIAEIPFKVSISYVHQAELQDFRGSLEVGKAGEAFLGEYPKYWRDWIRENPQCWCIF